MFFISKAFAQDIPVEISQNLAGVDGALPGTPPSGDPAMFNILLIIGLFVLFYFLMIRPQSKRMKEQKNMLDSLQKGDEVVTSGGIIGKITKLTDENEVEVEISKGVTVKLLRYTIQQRQDKKGGNDNSKGKAAEKETKTSAAVPKTGTKKTATKKAPAKKTPAKKTTTKKAS